MDQPEDAAAVEEVTKQIKRGFSLKDRLEKRGLRQLKIKLFLDENVGAEHKKVTDSLTSIRNTLNGVLPGDDMAESLGIDLAEFEAPVLDDAAKALLEKEAAELDAKREALEAKLSADSLVVGMRAVPPVMVKDCRRRAKATLEIVGKEVPEAKMDEFVRSYNGHLLSLVVQTITDAASGDVNEGLDYEGALQLIDFLPSGQYDRLSQGLAELQYRDAFSDSIESQEDFS